MSMLFTSAIYGTELECGVNQGLEGDNESEFSHRDPDHSSCDLDIISQENKLV